MTSNKETTYEVGTIAMATVRGVEDIRVVRLMGSMWRSAIVIGGHVHDSDEVTDVRRLAVLDPDDERIKAFLAAKWISGTMTYSLADLIREQLAPPRIPEPDWGVIVRAACDDPCGRLRWQRHRTSMSNWCSEAGHVLHWDDLRDPTIVSHDGGES